MPEPAAVPTENDVLLTRAQALDLLKATGRTVTRVERVCLDGAVLFVGAFDRLWTAWLQDVDGGTEVRYEEGWSARRGSCAHLSAPIVVAKPAAAPEVAPKPTPFPNPPDMDADVPDGA